MTGEGRNAFVSRVVDGIDIGSVSVVGLGYVGLTVAVCLASRGFRVTGIDVDAEKVEAVNRGRSPIYEPGLERLLRSSLRRGTLRATTDYGELVVTDVTFITVGTPSLPDGGIDLRYVVEASTSIGRALRSKEGKHLVVVKSTVLPGTTERVVAPTVADSSGKQLGSSLLVSVNPEFLREGSAVRDMLRPDRVVVGDVGDGSSRIVVELYREFYRRRMPRVLVTSAVNAEMIKYASNVFLAAKVSLINEVARICEKLPGADVTVVAEGVGLDVRIGPHFLRAGIGFGGSCFPKDVRALMSQARELGIEPVMLRSVLEVNERQPLRAVELAEEVVGDLRGKRAAVLGLAFKPNTDDVRESPAIRLVEELLRRGAEVRAYDPAAGPNAARVLQGRAEIVGSVEECLRDADVCFVATEWEEFRTLTPDTFKGLMRRAVVIDGRRVFEPSVFSRELVYRAIGLGPTVDAPSAAR
ncbi:MAG: UDP-glucose/GDP-mannose dehydrogenase family protein [Nitrososphaerota archaeon]|nr:UDP-glucose/GDP-mannose dehydrogenase family protein [Candidatus Calditenuis fumarioli]